MTTNATKDIIDLANPNTLHDQLRLIRLGKILRGQINQVLRKKAPVTDAGAPASTVSTIVLPNDARASKIERAWGRTGTAGTGELTIVAPGTNPASAGEISVQPDGNIMTLAADALTSVDVSYIPERGDVIALPSLPVASNSLALPAAITSKGVVLLLSVTADAGTVTGRKRVLVPAASAPATGNAKLNVAKTAIAFASADAVTMATATLLVCAADDLDTLLEAEAAIL